jgi:hypothetical protein
VTCLFASSLEQVVTRTQNKKQQSFEFLIIFQILQGVQQQVNATVELEELKVE